MTMTDARLRPTRRPPPRGAAPRQPETGRAPRGPPRPCPRAAAVPRGVSLGPQRADMFFFSMTESLPVRRSGRIALAGRRQGHRVVLHC